MPTMITRGAASARAFGLFVANALKIAFFDYFKSTAGNVLQNNFSIDGSDNIYYCGTLQGLYGSILKSNSDGTIAWQKQLSQTKACYSNAIMQSGSYVFVAADIGDSSVTYTIPHILKFDTSGNIQWQRGLKQNTSTWISNFYGLIVDSSLNSYICGTTGLNPGLGGQVAKYNTNGTFQWATILGVNSGSRQSSLRSICFDLTKANVFCAGDSVNSSLANVGLVAKFDSSGGIAWHRFLSSTNQVGATKVYSDSSSNCFVIAYTQVGSYQDVYLIKYNSSGTLQWQQRYIANANMYPRDIIIDSSNNMYLLSTVNNGISIIKTNSSGTVVWQKTLTSSFSFYGTTIALNSENKIVVSCWTSTSPVESFIFKIANDGALTGTFSANGYSFTYANSSFTSQAGGLTDAAGNLSGYTSGSIDQAGTATIGTPSPSITSTVTLT